MFEEHKKKGFFDGASSKLIFIFGLLLGVSIISIAGFGILLGSSLEKKGEISSDKSKTAFTNVEENNTSPEASPSINDKLVFRPVDESDHIRGNPNAKISIIEYSDLECPFCKRAHPTMIQLLAKYPNDVKWVYRHFPLRTLHSKAAKEAEATECAAELGGNDAFWKYIDKIFEITPSNDGLNLSELPNIAEQIGLKRSTFESCLNSGKFAKHVSEDENDAISAGGRGTPYFLILDSDGQPTPIYGAVPIEQFQAVIDSLL